MMSKEGLLNSKHEIRAKRPGGTNPKQFQNPKYKCSKLDFEFLSFDIRICFEFSDSVFEFVETQAEVNFSG